MTVVNRVLTALFDFVIGPAGALPAAAGLVLLAAATAVIVLVVFKRTSDQQSLAATKRAIQAAIFEMRLFSDDLAALIRAQAEALRQTLKYLRLSLVPTLWLLLPVLLLMLHMHFYFGYEGLERGRAALLTVELAPHPGESNIAQSALPAAQLGAPSEIAIETPAVVLPSAREIVWRIRPREEGTYELRISVNDEQLTKTVRVGDGVRRRSPVRPSQGFVAQLLNPSEPPIPAASGVRAITVTYPERSYEVAGWDLDWATIYLLLTVVFAFALRGVFGVTI